MKKIYQIIDWDKHYENAKSRTIEACSRCYFPNKQDGLGYGRLLRMDNGEAMYGAFVATAMICSKQKKRQGYLTDTGEPSGYPLSASDISIKTQFKEKTVQEMLEAVCLENIGWMRCISGDTEISARCTQGIPQVSTTRHHGILEGRKEGMKEGKESPPIFKIMGMDRISMERELQRITAELSKLGDLSDHERGDERYNRIKEINHRILELRKKLGVVG